MRKTPVVALIVVLALFISSAAPLLNAQNGGAPAAPPNDDMARRTLKAFAPFIRAILTRRINNAQQIFRIRRPVLTYLDQPESIIIFNRFLKPDAFTLNLVGGKALGNNLGILLFTIASNEGPVYFKIYYYGVEDTIYIDRMTISDDWDDLEAAAASIESLPSPVSIPMANLDEGGGQ
jgi:hypothetical protein